MSQYLTSNNAHVVGGDFTTAFRQQQRSNVMDILQKPGPWSEITHRLAEFPCDGKYHTVTVTRNHGEPPVARIDGKRVFCQLNSDGSISFN